MKTINLRHLSLSLLTAGTTLFGLANFVHAADAKKPNILVIWGDDIGYDNISAYNHGIMGYRTPNIDRLYKEGALFTDAYAQQSCTAGRASFILGEHPFRTGLLTIGMLPDFEPLRPEKPQGQYAVKIVFEGDPSRFRSARKAGRPFTAAACTAAGQPCAASASAATHG